MDATELILNFINVSKANPKIKPLHVSLYLALFQFWLRADCKNPIRISRRTVMNTAKVNSIATYHKGMQELCLSKYISYFPSYDPRIKSEVYLFDLKKEAVPEGTAP